MEIYFDGTHGFLRMGKSLMILAIDRWGISGI